MIPLPPLAVFGLGTIELLIIIFVSTGLGALIGYFKNRLILGIGLGFFLGFLGPIIMVFIPKDTKSKGTDNLDALLKLSELKKSGAITSAEFERKKAEYLK